MANTGKKKTTKTGAVRTVDMTRSAGKTIRAAERGVIDNIWGLCLIAIGVFIFAAVRFNSAGTVGNGLGNILKGVFGQVGMILPFYLILFGLLLLINKNMHISALTGSLGALIVLMMCLINSGRFIPKGGLPVDAKAFYASGQTLESGGFFGMVIGSVLVKYIGKVGLYGIAVAVILAAALLIINIPVSQMLSFFGEKNRGRRDRQAQARSERRKAIEAKEKEREKEAERRQIAREKAIAEERKARKYAYKQGAAVEIPLGELLAGGNLFGTTRGGKDKVDSQDMIDFFGYTRQPSQGNNYDDRAQHFIDLIENNFSSGSNGKKTRRRVTTSQAPTAFTTSSSGRGIGFGVENPYDAVNPSGGYGMTGGYGVDNGSNRRNNKKETPPTSQMDWTVNPYDDFGTTPKRKINTYNDEDKKQTSATVEKPREEKPKVDVGYKPVVETVDQTPAASISSATAANGAHDEPARPNVQKISNSQAEQATLNKSDFNKTKKPAKYKKPPIDILHMSDKSKEHRMSSDMLEEKANELEETFKSFNVGAKVIGVTQGPSVTRFEIQPDYGVKANKIVSLADDIALNLRAKSIRIEAPIPGKAAIGIEIENDNINMVTLREIIDSKEFKSASSKISFAVGRDIAGKPIIADLKGMPHLLIAGSTGSGKSVCINSIITSFLYKSDPDEVRLVLIDPKKVELGNYEGIPHLLIPVVTDPTKAAAALNWAVAEMNDRYQKFADARVKDLEGYNHFVRDMIAAGRADEDPEHPLEVLPQIVIIIDELADLMQAAPSQVETSISRLTALARAAGMHLIVATQRPSVDVITGVIKANIPSRIAFAVASQFDSRTILDMGGAEKLAGKGDMLYNPLGQKAPVRVQGCFIDEEETNAIIEFVKGQAEAVYDETVKDKIERGDAQSGGAQDNRDDEILQEAIQFVIQQGKASTSLVQRRFRVGYNRAANIMDAMESMGVIGPQDGSKAREVIWTDLDYQNWLSNGSGDVQDY